MVVDDTDGLQIGVDDHGADELKSTLFQIPADQSGQLVLSRQGRARSEPMIAP